MLDLEEAARLAEERFKRELAEKLAECEAKVREELAATLREMERERREAEERAMSLQAELAALRAKTAAPNKLVVDEYCTKNGECVG